VRVVCFVCGEKASWEDGGIDVLVLKGEKAAAVMAAARQEVAAALVLLLAGFGSLPRFCCCLGRAHRV
jgi:hypothetical protein